MKIKDSVFIRKAEIGKLIQSLSGAVVGIITLLGVFKVIPELFTISCVVVGMLAYAGGGLVLSIGFGEFLNKYKDEEVENFDNSKF